MILEHIASPADVKELTVPQLKELCGDLRRFLVESVARTGGHLASNLGAVELTVALHRTYDTSRDRLVFDVGHQCYVHKALTGRRGMFDALRQLGGLSGFPKPEESVHDAFVAGHASNSVSVALGMARARTLSGQDYSVAALIGDGALTGGLAYEGLSDAGASGEPMVVILNDNGMSIDPNVGGVADHLSRLRTSSAFSAPRNANSSSISSVVRRNSGACRSASAKPFPAMMIRRYTSSSGSIKCTSQVAATGFPNSSPRRTIRRTFSLRSSLELTGFLLSRSINSLFPRGCISR